MIYKILNSLPAEADIDSVVDPEGVIPTTELDAKDGFIHLSVKGEVVPTLNKFFVGINEVYVLYVDIPDDRNAIIDEGAPGNRQDSKLKWEWVESRNAWFPHIYGQLLSKDIVRVEKLTRLNGNWLF
jgi:uncharacterized protein (DUF952 family)